MRPLFFAVLAACFALAALAGYAASPSFELRFHNDAQPRLIAVAAASPPAFSNSVRLKLPAVSKSGQGALADFTAAAATGEGRLFLRFDTGSPLANPDTQTSLRTAFDVATRLCGQDASKIDVYYYFNADSDVVGGQSAGAAMAVATLSAITGTPLRSDALITGILDSDGSIGRVGKVLAKAKAAKAAGYSVLLVPVGESREITYAEKCKNERIDGGYYQTCSSEPMEVSVASESGMEIIEVSDVQEAFEIMKG
ncbi:MAG: S16 family serine protease [Candidatus Micrarchaeota archaeon]